MKTKLFLVPCLLFAASLTSCGNGPVRITGTRAELFIRDENEEYVQMECEYTKIDKKEVPYYKVQLSSGNQYLMKIYPIWKGSRQVKYSGDVANFEKSDYWTISYNENSESDPEYYIDFDYPPHLYEPAYHVATYQVDEFEGKIYFELRAYGVPT